MGLFGRKEVAPEKPERPPAPPALTKVKVISPDGKVLYEVDLISEDTARDEIEVWGPTPNNKKVIVIRPGANLLVIEEDAEDEEDE